MSTKLFDSYKQQLHFSKDITPFLEPEKCKLCLPEKNGKSPTFKHARSKYFHVVTVHANQKACYDFTNELKELEKKSIENRRRFLDELL